MEQGSAFPHGFKGVEDGGKLLVLDDDEVESFLGDVEVLGGYSGHTLADEADVVFSQHRDVEDAPTVPDAAHVASGEDGVDPGHSGSLGGVDAGDACVGQGAAEGLSP